MTRTRWIIFAVICIAVLGGLVFFSSQGKVDVSKIDEKKPVTEGAIKDHVFGTNSGKVMLIEYGDFQCPGCKSLYPNAKSIKEHYKDQLTFVFRDFPLTSIHPNALAAATAAEAAGLQNKFYDMHDKLYMNQDAWKNANPDDRITLFKEYATQIGLNITKFEKDLASSDVADKIRRDQALGAKANVTSTPSLFLNSETIDGDTWQSLDKFEIKVREAIKASGQELPKPLSESIAE
jgi:protein-disulfide isomerase